MSDADAENTSDSEAEKKRRKNERQRRRRAEDPELREKDNRRKRERRKRRYAENPQLREEDNRSQNERRKRQRAEKPEWWAEEKRRNNERRKKQYAEDPELREQLKRVSRENYHKNAEVISIKKLAKAHGISVEQCTEMLARQNGICAICLKRSKKRLRFDHDHKTLQLRSLLCDKCNIGLGYYDDDSAAMRRGADYLEYWQWRHANPDSTSPPQFALSCLHRFFDAKLPPISLPSIQSPPLTGEDMTPTQESNDEPAEADKASRIMRRAILHELHQPLDPDASSSIDKLRAIARAIVDKATQGDMTAAKEVLDRIDGRTPTAAPASAESPNEMWFTWQPPV